MGDVLFDSGGRRYKVKEVTVLQAMGAMITHEADSMSAMRFRMRKADKAWCVDTKFYKNTGIAKGRKHKRFREVVQACFHHSRESCSWNKEMVDTLPGKAEKWIS